MSGPGPRRWSLGALGAGGVAGGAYLAANLTGGPRLVQAALLVAALGAMTAGAGSLALAALGPWPRPDAAGGREPLLERRSFLAGSVGLAGGAVGAALVAADRPLAVPAGPAAVGASRIDVRQFAHLAAGAEAGGDPATWDWTRAVLAAVEYAKARAAHRQRQQGSLLDHSFGQLPPLYFPAGTYRITAPIPLHFLRGFTVEGDGRQSTVLLHEAGTVLFDVRRSSALHFQKLTIQGSAPGADGPVRGLVEGSCGFHFEEHAADPLQGGNTLMVRCTDVEVNELHRAFHFVGDQMTDGVVCENLRTRDNFYDFDYENSQAVNHQVFGGELLYGVSYPQAAYQRRLDRWSGRPHLYDGAVVNVRSGGQLTVFGGSIIGLKPTLLLRRPPGDGSQGARSNVLPYMFFGTRWEMRRVDRELDPAGLQRLTMIRYADPFPTDARTQPSVRFQGCDWNVQAEPLHLVYLANAVTVTMDACRVWPAERARLVTLVNQATAAGAGSFRSRGTPLLRHERRAAPGFAPGPGSDQVVEMTAAPSPLALPLQAAGEYHSLLPSVAGQLRRVVYHGPDGSLAPAGGAAPVALHLPVNGNAIIKQVGVVCLAAAGPGGATFTFANSSGTRTYARLELRSDGAGRFDGTTLDAHPKPYRLVEEYADADGQVLVRAAPPPPPGMRGYVYVDYL